MGPSISFYPKWWPGVEKAHASLWTWLEVASMLHWPLCRCFLPAWPRLLVLNSQHPPASLTKAYSTLCTGEGNGHVKSWDSSFSPETFFHCATTACITQWNQALGDSFSSTNSKWEAGSNPSCFGFFPQWYFVKYFLPCFKSHWIGGKQWPCTFYFMFSSKNLRPFSYPFLFWDEFLLYNTISFSRWH